MEYEKIEQTVKQLITEKRFIHSLGVVERAVELAKVYNIDEEIVKKVAIAHDVAKQMSKEESLEYAKQHNIQFDEIELNNPGIMHSKVGAEMSKEKFGFTQQMANAILYHTTGNVDMDDLAKIIYIADKTEKNRTHIDIEKAVEIAKNNLDQAILYISKNTLQYNLEKGVLIHPDTIYLINKIILEENQ